jgi:asparagine synthase (glutamine-hydrolysing)
MCGLAGFLSSGARMQEANAVLSSMSKAILSRGPDDFGLWFDEVGIGLTHRRLSILDLSPAGHQPMVSECGRYVIAYNGEIYNHLDLRKELSSSNFNSINTHWRGHSDTETLLAGFSFWGIKATIERCMGMFAFAVWDKKERVLTLGRDRLGEKPIYYGWQGSGNESSFFFGSELKAIKAHPEFAGKINRDSLCLLMRYSYIPAPHSIYEGIYKLPAGNLLTVSLNRREPVLEAYWSLTDVAINGNRSKFQGSTNEMVGALEDLLMSSVQQQMISDVPVGAFLSGGIDSSTVVALMQAQSDRPVKTFTIGFKEGDYDEAVHAKAVANYLGTDHTELYVAPQQALEVIPRLPSLFCEPFADPSQIPTFLVSQLAKQKVTVSLSGDGGDELFAGYNRYVLAHNIWSQASRLPAGIRSLASSGINTISPLAWNKLLSPLQKIAPRSLRHSNIGDKLHKLAGLFGARNIDDFYLSLVTHWQPQDLVIDGKEPATCVNEGRLTLEGLDNIQRMMVLDSITYLPDDILIKVDRASMGVSLEGRMPFLNHRVVEFAWQLPNSMKLRDGVGKWILRQVLYRYVPKELIERPKMGFGVPIDAWLRGPLKNWAEALLDEERLRREGYFNPAPIRIKWAEHISGHRNWQYVLWNVLMFQSWLEVQTN